jgi:hypothetical protein
VAQALYSEVAMISQTPQIQPVNTNVPGSAGSIETNPVKATISVDPAKQDTPPSLGDEIVLAFPFLALVTLAAFAFYVAKRSQVTNPTHSTNDSSAFFKSLRVYVSEHSIIFAYLSAFAACTYGAWALVIRIKHPKPHWTSIEELTLALFAGFATALIIFLLTDFAAKRAQEMGNREIKASFDRHSTALSELLAVSTTSGLRAYPSIEGKRLRPTQIFEQYLEDKDVVRVSSSAGTRWMQLEQSGHVSKDRLTLPLLYPKHVKLCLLVHSPLAEALSVLRDSGHQTPRDPKCIALLLSNRNIPLSQVSIAQGLVDHLKFFNKTLPDLQRIRHKSFEMEVKLTPRRLNSDFFTVGPRAVFGAYPMANRSHQHAISVSVRDPLRTPASASAEDLVKVFTDEFDHFWHDPVSAFEFGKFMQDNKALIESLLRDTSLFSELTT